MLKKNYVARSKASTNIKTCSEAKLQIKPRKRPRKESLGTETVDYIPYSHRRQGPLLSERATVNFEDGSGSDYVPSSEAGESTDGNFQDPVLLFEFLFVVLKWVLNFLYFLNLLKFCFLILEDDEEKIRPERPRKRRKVATDCFGDSYNSGSDSSPTNPKAARIKGERCFFKFLVVSCTILEYRYKMRKNNCFLRTQFLESTEFSCWKF